MKFFVDTADVAVIKELAATGLLDGVTTNPSLVAKEGRDFKTVVQEICEIVSGPVSAEVAATDYEGMVAEGRVLAALAKNVCIKVPLTWDGLKACRTLASEGRMVNVILCFSANQALLAAKAGATFVSPLHRPSRRHRPRRNGADPRNTCDLQQYPDLTTEILAASIRTVNHVKQAAMIGADVATVPPGVLKALVNHPLTDIGLRQFVADWEKTAKRWPKRLWRDGCS